ncbi:hypothetical protein ACWD3J_48610 [Streptomyces sp. NPDC002755]|uniref:hypothetical protein n=1 Tax=Streptomyces sp. NPDC002884 TaxID=3154544 RepID=UPI00333415E1
MAAIGLAIRQALSSKCRYRVGAVLISGNRVLAAGPNTHRNSSMVDFRHATFHAEEVVLRRVKSTPRRAEIFVARVNRAGTPLLARPCLRCQKALAFAGIHRAHFTTNDCRVESIDISEIPLALSSGSVRVPGSRIYPLHFAAS